MKIILYLEKNYTLFGNLSVATLAQPPGAAQRGYIPALCKMFIILTCCELLHQNKNWDTTFCHHLLSSLHISCGHNYE